MLSLLTTIVALIVLFIVLKVAFVLLATVFKVLAIPFKIGGTLLFGAIAIIGTVVGLVLLPVLLGVGAALVVPLLVVVVPLLVVVAIVSAGLGLFGLVF